MLFSRFSLCNLQPPSGVSWQWLLLVNNEKIFLLFFFSPTRSLLLEFKMYHVFMKRKECRRFHFFIHSGPYQFDIILLNFWDKDWEYVSFRLFRLLFSSRLLFSHFRLCFTCYLWIISESTVERQIGDNGELLATVFLISCYVISAVPNWFEVAE